MLYKGVWIENLPMKHCSYCHEDVCDWETVQLAEAIANDPEQYAEVVKRPIACLGLADIVTRLEHGKKYERL